MRALVACGLGEAAASARAQPHLSYQLRTLDLSRRHGLAVLPIPKDPCRRGELDEVAKWVG